MAVHTAVPIKTSRMQDKDDDSLDDEAHFDVRDSTDSFLRGLRSEKLKAAQQAAGARTPAAANTQDEDQTSAATASGSVSLRGSLSEEDASDTEHPSEQLRFHVDLDEVEGADVSSEAARSGMESACATQGAPQGEDRAPSLSAWPRGQPATAGLLPAADAEATPPVLAPTPARTQPTAGATHGPSHAELREPRDAQPSVRSPDNSSIGARAITDTSGAVRSGQPAARDAGSEASSVSTPTQAVAPASEDGGNAETPGAMAARPVQEAREGGISADNGDLEGLAAPQSLARLHAMMRSIQEAGEQVASERATPVGVDVAVERYLGMAEAADPPLTGDAILRHALRLAVQDRINTRACAFVACCHTSMLLATPFGT